MLDSVTFFQEVVSHSCLQMGGVLTIGSGIAKTNKPYPWDPGTTASTFPWLCLSPFHLGILAFRHLPWILNSLSKSFILALGSESSSTLPSLGVFTEIQLKKNVKFTVIHSEDFYKKWASYPGLQEGQDKPPPKRGRRAPNPTPASLLWWWGCSLEGDDAEPPFVGIFLSAVT